MGWGKGREASFIPLVSQNLFHIPDLPEVLCSASAHPWQAWLSTLQTHHTTGGHHHVCCLVESPLTGTERMSSLLPVNNSKLGDLPGSFSIYRLLGYRDICFFTVFFPLTCILCALPRWGPFSPGTIYKHPHAASLHSACLHHAGSQYFVIWSHKTFQSSLKSEVTVKCFWVTFTALVIWFVASSFQISPTYVSSSLLQVWTLCYFLG